MRKRMEKYGLTLIGVVFGALAGYFYYRQVGCVDGSCPITSSPWLSSVWGAAFGGLLASMFKRKPKEDENGRRCEKAERPAEAAVLSCGAGVRSEGLRRGNRSSMRACRNRLRRRSRSGNAGYPFATVGIRGFGRVGNDN
ncbi:DUF6132 family protein [Alistipes ihumii]|uniref:DUF6132 family protein n=1 Tax=Alistipes ihumii TaxID=1470347 RepID=UPI003F5867FF